MQIVSILSQRLLAALVAATLAVPAAGQPAAVSSGYPAGPPASGSTPAALPVAAGSSGAQLMDECLVLARIDGEVVQASEVLWIVNDAIARQMESIPPAQRANIPAAEIELAKRMLTQQVLASRFMDRKLLIADFRRNIPDASARLDHIAEKEAARFDKERVPELMKQFQAENMTELQRKLTEMGTSLEDQRREMIEELVSFSWLMEMSDYDKVVTHDELLAYYNEHSAEYEYPTQARWEELMVRLDRFANWEDALDAICQMGNNAYLTAAQNSAFRGPAFADIARASSHGFTASEGGIHDWTVQGSLRAEAIDRALFTLQVGQMSDVLQSDQGLHIVRVLERKEAGREPFTKVQTQIREKILLGRITAARGEYLDTLRRNARIWTAFAGDISYEQLAARPDAPERR